MMAGEGLRAVLQVAAALHESGSSAVRFYRAAVEAVVTTVGADRAALLLYDPDGVMRFKAWRGLSEAYRQAVEGHTPWSPDDAAAKPILVRNVYADPEMAEFWPVFGAEGIGALAFVPLVHQEHVVGKFMLYYDKPHDFSESELAVAEVPVGDRRPFSDLSGGLVRLLQIGRQPIERSLPELSILLHPLRGFF